MNAYVCVECGWEYQIFAMEDRVEAVKRHQLGHLLARHGWTGATRDVIDSLMMDPVTASRPQFAQHQLPHNPVVSHGD